MIHNIQYDSNFSILEVRKLNFIAVSANLKDISGFFFLFCDIAKFVFETDIVILKVYISQKNCGTATTQEIQRRPILFSCFTNCLCWYIIIMKGNTSLLLDTSADRRRRKPFYCFWSLLVACKGNSSKLHRCTSPF